MIIPGHYKVKVAGIGQWILYFPVTGDSPSKWWQEQDYLRDGKSTQNLRSIVFCSSCSSYPSQRFPCRWKDFLPACQQWSSPLQSRGCSAVCLGPAALTQENSRLPFMASDPKHGGDKRAGAEMHWPAPTALRFESFTTTEAGSWDPGQQEGWDSIPNTNSKQPTVRLVSSISHHNICTSLITKEVKPICVYLLAMWMLSCDLLVRVLCPFLYWLSMFLLTWELFTYPEGVLLFSYVLQILCSTLWLAFSLS